MTPGTRTSPRRSPPWALAALALALAAPTLAAEPAEPKAQAAQPTAPAPITVEKTAEKKLTIVFTGDNGGEVAPCG